jgi:hypothetical protein
MTELLPGSSALLPTKCTASTGPANVDGLCIMGGSAVPVGMRGYYVPSVGLESTSQCAAFPVYLMTNVPYTRGRVAGPDYAELAGIYSNTRLNQKWASRH